MTLEDAYIVGIDVQVSADTGMSICMKLQRGSQRKNWVKFNFVVSVPGVLERMTNFVSIVNQEGSKAQSIEIG